MDEGVLLYRDGLILVLNKPAGLPVHAGPGGGATVEDHLNAFRYGLPGKPALAHRLDRDTSGCLVLGRHAKALRRLGRLFSSGVVEKTYIAVVNGRLTEQEGLIDAPLAKRSSRQQLRWWMEVAEGGKPSQTRYRHLSYNEQIDCSLVEFRPLTGRTHQIRVHAAHIGCPLVGDSMYGGGEGNPLLPHAASFRLLLHAVSIVLPLYPAREPLNVEAPLPAYWPAGAFNV